MGFHIQGSIADTFKEAENHAVNLDKEKLDSSMNIIRNYFANKKPLYRRFLRLKADAVIGKYESAKSCIEESSYLMDLAGQ